MGLDPIGERDGRIGLYLAEKLSAALADCPQPAISADCEDDAGKGTQGASRSGDCRISASGTGLRSFRICMMA